jgi:hypothetical protein
MAAMETSEAQRNITRNVRILMAARDMYEQRQLADALGWPSAKMTKTLKGDRRWSVEDLYEVAQVFGITAGALLGSTAEVVAAAGPTVANPVNGSVTSRYSMPEPRPVVREAQVIPFPLHRKGVIPLDAPDRFIVRHVG